ncbi:hypothetical protein [Aeromicrobium piscarium]|uniref:Exonuclease domain-containing protein n=1 Tax=Aeromicrobium piscarium TaxID=2590901 RepID=A0A554SP36_9ACTN|nr:hypothetical protein [Aeromicrobium piscarium]TSD68100.1 hypothetical protein FNM00_00450 [Aeromicrobium piscarium]
MTFIYVDTETTSLDPSKGEIWELAYAIDDGEIFADFLPHDLMHAQPAALRIGRYLDRVPDVIQGRSSASTPFETEAMRAMKGATIVGANPAFDTSFLRARWGRAPWHHRLLDIETYAMPAFGWDEPRGLKDVAEACRQLGVEIPEPDHTAAGDVATVRMCHQALSDWYRRQL